MTRTKLMDVRKRTWVVKWKSGSNRKAEVRKKLGSCLISKILLLELKPLLQNIHYFISNDINHWMETRMDNWKRSGVSQVAS